MIDANVIISAILFPNSIISDILKHIIQKNKIILSKYTVDEIRDVFDRKFPHRINEMEIFLEKLPYKRFELKKIHNKKYPNIRDINDMPVLVSAIESNVDMLITGDKDFDDIEIKRPIIIKPNKYKKEYM